MKRTNIFATERQLKELKKFANKMGLPMAEVIRRAIDLFLDYVSETPKNKQ